MVRAPARTCAQRWQRARASLPLAPRPSPLAGPHDWSYEPGDTIYFFVSFSEPIIVSGGVPSLLCAPAAAADVRAAAVIEGALPAPAQAQHGVALRGGRG